MELEAPYEDVPDHLFQPLWGWLREALNNYEFTFALCMSMRLSAPDSRAGWEMNDKAVKVVARAVADDHNFLLDCAEWALAFTDPVGMEGYRRIEKLTEILTLGNSAYAIRADGRGLELRILPEVRDQVQTVVDAAPGSPGEHLTAAWTAAYSRTPDSVRSYAEAIKAVEAAAASTISPKNLKATLGTMIRDMKAAPHKWTFAIARPNGDSVEDVQRLMSLLWEGQTSRHGGVNPTVPETIEAARAATHIAATLVQFFVGKSLTTRA